MALASLQDINKHLDQFKIELQDAEDAPLQLSAERMIKGTLAYVYRAIDMAQWTTPESTPGLIREIAGKYIAALYYRRTYSEDIADISPYAQLLYQEALMQLDMVRTGQIKLVDISEDTVVTAENVLDPTMFYPNADAPAPMFTMDMTF